MARKRDSTRKPGERRGRKDTAGVARERRADERRQGRRRKKKTDRTPERRSGKDRRNNEQRSGSQRRSGDDRRAVPERLNRVSAILLPRLLSSVDEETDDVGPV